MLSERPMDWTHRLFNQARSSRSQTLTDNQTVRLCNIITSPLTCYTSNNNNIGVIWGCGAARESKN